MYDGKKSYSFFTSDPKPLFDQLLKRKYKGYIAYAHNLSNFDLIFLFKYLSSLQKLFKINVIKRDNIIINIQVLVNKKYKISFRDSLSFLRGNKGLLNLF